MKRIVIYVDGSNFYFSVNKTFNCKIDIEKFCKKLAGENNLIEIKYYIAPIEQLNNPEMYAKQQSFFDKIREIKSFEKEITYIAIGNNKMISYHLKNVASKTKRIDKNFIEDIKL